MLTALTWSILAIALKIAVSFVDSISLVGLRFSIATCVMLFFVYRRSGNLSILSRPPKALIFAGLLLAANYLGFMKAVELTSPSNAQLGIQLGPILFAFLGLAVFKEAVQARQIIGLIAVVVGLLIFYNDQKSVFSDHAVTYHMGWVWLLMAAGTWACFALIQKSVSHNHCPRELNLVVYATAAVLYLGFIDVSRVADLSWLQWALILYLGFNTIVAYGALTEALKRLPANKVAVIITLNPMITLILMRLLGDGFLFQKTPERIQTMGYVGAGAMILGALAVVSAKTTKTEPRPQTLRAHNS